MKLHVTYSETRTGGIAKSRERFSDRTPTIVDFKVLGVSTEVPDNPYYEVIDVQVPEEVGIPSEVYVIHVSYGSGDTFGHSNGNGAIIGGCLTRDEANAILDSVGNKTHPSSYIWNGYFETLESAHAILLPVNAGIGKGLSRFY